MTAPKPVLAISAFMARSRGHCAVMTMALLALALGTGYLASCGSLSCAQPTLSVFELQFVGTRDGAVALLRQLTASEQLAAAKSCMVWDFAFIAAYVVGLSTIFTYVTRNRPELHPATHYAIPAILVAAAFDVIEDVCLLALLAQDAGGPPAEWLGLWAGATTTAALGKWTLLLWVAGALTSALARATHLGTANPEDSTGLETAHDPTRRAL